MIRDCLEDEITLAELRLRARLVAIKYGARRDYFAHRWILGQRVQGTGHGKDRLLATAWPTLEETFDAVTARDLLAACRSLLTSATPVRPWADFAARGAWKG